MHLGPFGPIRAFGAPRIWLAPSMSRCHIRLRYVFLDEINPKAADWTSWRNVLSSWPTWLVISTLGCFGIQRGCSTPSTNGAKLVEFSRPLLYGGGRTESRRRAKRPWHPRAGGCSRLGFPRWFSRPRGQSCCRGIINGNLGFLGVLKFAL